MARYVEKPVPFEAVQWLGNDEPFDGECVGLKFNEGAVQRLDGGITLRFDEKEYTVAMGDWIVKWPGEGVLGVVDGETFALSYDPETPEAPE